MTKSRIVREPAYQLVLELYNDEMVKTKGNVNNLKFYREVVALKMPKISQQSWYNFLKKFKSNVEIVRATAITQAEVNKAPVRAGEEPLAVTLLSNEEATQKGIKAALSIGASALQEIADNPDVLKAVPHEKRIELLFKAMKAQDSRIHALGKVRDDQREQAKFERTFQDASLD